MFPALVTECQTVRVFEETSAEFAFESILPRFQLENKYLFVIFDVNLVGIDNKCRGPIEVKRTIGALAAALDGVYTLVGVELEHEHCVQVHVADEQTIEMRQGAHAHRFIHTCVFAYELGADTTQVCALGIHRAVEHRGINVEPFGEDVQLGEWLADTCDTLRVAWCLLHSYGYSLS